MRDIKRKKKELLNLLKDGDENRSMMAAEELAGMNDTYQKSMGDEKLKLIKLRNKKLKAL